MSKKRPTFGVELALTILLFVIVITAPIAWVVFQWNECRDSGLSFWYCVQHIL